MLSITAARDRRGFTSICRVDRRPQLLDRNHDLSPHVSAGSIFRSFKLGDHVPRQRYGVISVAFEPAASELRYLRARHGGRLSHRTVACARNRASRAWQLYSGALVPMCVPLHPSPQHALRGSTCLMNASLAFTPRGRLPTLTETANKRCKPSALRRRSSDPKCKLRRSKANRRLTHQHRLVNLLSGDHAC
jgi:hypothetical protein